MDKEFLLDLGVDDDIVDNIIARHSEEVNNIRLDFAVERELSKRGAKNISAAMKLIDKSGLSYDNGYIEGLSEKIESFATENDFLFEKENKIPFFSKPASRTKGITKSEFEKMGYENRLRLFNESPDLYKKLTRN